MKEEDFWTYTVVVFALTFVPLSIIVIVRSATTNGSLLAHPVWRVVVSAGLVFWGFAYFFSKELGLTKVFGVLQIIVGVLSNWYQLGKIGEAGWHGAVYERWAFIAGSLAFIANGFHDVFGNRFKEPDKPR